MAKRPITFHIHRATVTDFRINLQLLPTVFYKVNIASQYNQNENSIRITTQFR